MYPGEAARKTNGAYTSPSLANDGEQRLEALGLGRRQVRADLSDKSNRNNLGGRVKINKKLHAPTLFSENS